MQGASAAGGGGAAETDEQEVALLLARFACNALTICDDELQPVGAAPDNMLRLSQYAGVRQVSASELGQDMKRRLCCMARCMLNP